MNPRELADLIADADLPPGPIAGGEESDAAFVARCQAILAGEVSEWVDAIEPADLARLCDLAERAATERSLAGKARHAAGILCANCQAERQRADQLERERDELSINRNHWEEVARQQCQRADAAEARCAGSQDALHEVMGELRQIGDLLDCGPEEAVLDAAERAKLALDLNDATQEKLTQQLKAAEAARAAAEAQRDEALALLQRWWVDVRIWAEWLPGGKMPDWAITREVRALLASPSAAAALARREKERAVIEAAMEWRRCWEGRRGYEYGKVVEGIVTRLQRAVDALAAQEAPHAP